MTASNKPESSKPGQFGAVRSGLTGPVEMPDVLDRHAEGRPKGVRERGARAREAMAGTVVGLPRVLGLVWRASRRLTIGMALATVVTGLTPAATAYAARLLLNAVADGIRIREEHRPDQTVVSLPLPGHTLSTPVMTTLNAILLLVGAQLVIFAMAALFTAIRSICQQLLQEKVALEVQTMVVEQASRLDLAFFEDSKSYDLLREAQQGASTRPVSMISSAFGLIQSAITFTSMVAILIGLNPLLALVALLAPVPAFISDSKYGMRSFQAFRLASPIARRMQYVTMLVTTNLYAKEIKLFGLGGYLVKRFRLLGEKLYERRRRLVARRYLMATAWSSVTTMAGSLTYLYVALEALAGRLTLGDLLLYTAAATAVQSSIQGMFQAVTGVYENNLYIDNLYLLLAAPIRIRRPDNPRPLPTPVRGHVVFEDVSFSYPGSANVALDRVSFEILPGQTIAIVGRNGAGKSTLVKLLCRLYDPTEGRILLDGVDLRDVDPKQLRANIGAMFQDYVNYQATVGENIGIGDVRHIEDRSRIEWAAAKAGATSLVERMPAGFDTPLGKWFDTGVDVSGGEWQKIALARAFMRDVPMLVLDEPTSALDAEAEYELFARLRQHAVGRTTVYISHRFSTVRQADRICVVEGGRLVEHGTHAELMGLDGRYARLFTMQAAAYTDGGRAPAPSGQPSGQPSGPSAGPPAAKLAGPLPPKLAGGPPPPAKLDGPQPAKGATGPGPDRQQGPRPLH